MKSLSKSTSENFQQNATPGPTMLPIKPTKTFTNFELNISHTNDIPTYQQKWKTHEWTLFLSFKYYPHLPDITLFYKNYTHYIASSTKNVERKIKKSGKKLIIDSKLISTPKKRRMNSLKGFSVRKFFGKLNHCQMTHYSWKLRLLPRRFFDWTKHKLTLINFITG